MPARLGTQADESPCHDIGKAANPSGFHLIGAQRFEGFLIGRFLNHLNRHAKFSLQKILPFWNGNIMQKNVGDAKPEWF